MLHAQCSSIVCLQIETFNETSTEVFRNRNFMYRVTDTFQTLMKTLTQLKVHGPISQNGVFNLNDASSSLSEMLISDFIKVVKLFGCVKR